MKTRPVVNENNNGGKEYDTRRIEVDLFNTKQRELKVTIVWIGG